MEAMFLEATQELGEDYINIEVDSFPSTNSFIHTNQDFEFQSLSTTSDDPRDHNTTPSPADELFYMGKLLPLTKIPQHESQSPFSTPLFTPTQTANATPFQSCHVSPCQSRHVSGEINPHDYFLDYPTLSMEDKQQSWTKRLKLMINKSSKAYLKSLFSKKPSGCSDGYSKGVAIPKAKESRDEYLKRGKNDNVGHSHRRSFSGAFKTFSGKDKVSTKCSTPTTKLKRSNSSSSELENPIQAAIAHCKRSQSKQQFYSARVNDEERPSRLYRG